MNYKIKYTLILSFCATVAIANDVSVFDAGNLDTKNPYGLTKAEKMSVANNDKINTLSSKVDALSSSQSDKINSLSIKIDSLNLKQDEIFQKIEGISTIIESDSKKNNNTKLYVKNNETKIEEQNLILSNRVDSALNKLELLDKKLDNFIASQSKNNKILEESNTKLLSIMNKINADYVKKAEYDELVSFINKTNVKSSGQPVLVKQDKIDKVEKQPKIEKVEKTEKQPKNEKNEKVIIEATAKNQDDRKVNKELHEEAIELVKNRYFTKALPILENLLESKYKVAETNFYLGEIKYNKKLYKEAIQFYKQSMISDDKASYIPTLLLHSALCFDNLKEKDNAMNFYKTIVEIYPDTPEAKEASKKIKTQKKEK
jgi:TolA-binding protein